MLKYEVWLLNNETARTESVLEGKGELMQRWIAGSVYYSSTKTRVCRCSSIFSIEVRNERVLGAPPIFASPLPSIRTGFLLWQT